MMDYKELINCGIGWSTTHFGRGMSEPSAIISKMAIAIETLLAERESAGWISVDDVLPETNPVEFDEEEEEYSRESESVLTLDRGGNIRVSYLAVMKPIGEEEIKCFIGRHDDFGEIDGITHWMPLPELPCFSEKRGDTP